MYAIIQIGSSQFKISEGDVVDACQLPHKEGDELLIDKVLLYHNEKDIRVGQPYLKDVKVTAKVLKHHLGQKVTAFKFRRRKDSSTKRGHRQKLTALNITKISG